MVRQSPQEIQGVDVPRGKGQGQADRQVIAQSLHYILREGEGSHHGI